jgi:pimeloyl-ACP methyl ester carboxylesterase
MDGYTPLVDEAIVFGDGRKLRYAEWGVPSGRPMFLFHGAPGSRVFAPDQTVTAGAGVRLITVDRPGYAGSDPLPGRQILDWPSDVVALAGALGINQFDVAAHSSGGPYALACAVRLPDRVRRVVLVSCIAPQDALHPDGLDGDDEDVALTRRAREDPAGAAAAVAESVAWLLEAPERFLELPRPEPDVLLLDDQAVREMFLRTIQEAVRQGVDAYAWDVVLERRPWGFDLSDIHAEVMLSRASWTELWRHSRPACLRESCPRATSELIQDQGMVSSLPTGRRS